MKSSKRKPYRLTLPPYYLDLVLFPNQFPLYRFPHSTRRRNPNDTNTTTTIIPSRRNKPLESPHLGLNPQHPVPKRPLGSIQLIQLLIDPRGARSLQALLQDLPKGTHRSKVLAHGLTDDTGLELKIADLIQRHVAYICIYADSFMPIHNPNVYQFFRITSETKIKLVLLVNLHHQPLINTLLRIPDDILGQYLLKGLL